LATKNGAVALKNSVTAFLSKKINLPFERVKDL